MMDVMGEGHWVWGGMWLVPLLFWILIIAGVVFIVRWIAGDHSHQTSSYEALTETPLDILKRRYAKGEIDQDTFETMKRDIKDDKP